jgi:Tfp pilus assembly pilus retraction ATPase PilT
MESELLIESATGGGASDFHLEAGLPAVEHVRGHCGFLANPFHRRRVWEDSQATTVK